MNNEEFLRLLREATYSEPIPEPNDAEVDAFLSVPSDCSPETHYRIEARFVQKLFEEVHRLPAQSLAAKWPFNRWLESMRESARLTTDDVAIALGKGREFVERLENGEQLPWELKTTDVCDVVCLFRVHIKVVAELIANSAAIAGFSGLGVVAARAHRGRMSEQRGRSAKRALDLYVARNATPVPMSPSMSLWLEQLRRELENRQATDLL